MAPGIGAVPQQAQPVAVGYVRRSKAADAKVVSLEVQRAAIEGYCAAQGWQLAGLLEHDGVSGGKRSRFAQMDAAIKAHGARFIVAYHLDRTARDCAGFLDWCEALPKRGVELHVVGRGNVR